jgi:hypothetical protein
MTTATDEEVPLTTVVTSEVMLGMAKKMNAEMEKLPLQSHAAIINFLTSLVQHRQITMKILMDEKAARIQQNQVDLMVKEQERQAAQQARRDLGIVVPR